MAIHLLRDLEQLKKELLNVGALVEEAVHKAIVALVERRADLAEEVKRGDRQVDDQELKVEDECLKLLALHQPVASDLRYVVAMLKVNNDLERVGDLAGNIASRAIALATGDPVPVPAEILGMSERVERMLRDALNAMVDSDTDLARQVHTQDEAVDAMHKAIFGILEDRMAEQPDTIGKQIHLLSVSRYLERMADLATNIAEDVIFMVEGELVRHQTWQ